MGDGLGDDDIGYHFEQVVVDALSSTFAPGLGLGWGFGWWKCLGAVGLSSILMKGSRQDTNGE